MIVPCFDRGFIKTWEGVYYQCDKAYEDEKTYKSLIERVASDVIRKGTLSENTLRHILKWKLGERYGQEDNVDWQRYATVYAPRFRIIITRSISDQHKLFVLIWDAKKLKSQLPVESGVLKYIQGKPKGFGVPVASTILHFVFPNGFPIIDVRTAEVLYLASRIDSPDRYDYRVYYPFRAEMLQIQDRSGSCLHEVDRALFAYHRDVVQPEMNRVFKAWALARYPDFTSGLPIDAPAKLRQSILDTLKQTSKASEETQA